MDDDTDEIIKMNRRLEEELAALNSDSESDNDCTDDNLSEASEEDALQAAWANLERLTEETKNVESDIISGLGALGYEVQQQEIIPEIDEFLDDIIAQVEIANVPYVNSMEEHYSVNSENIQEINNETRPSIYEDIVDTNIEPEMVQTTNPEPVELNQHDKVEENEQEENLDMIFMQQLAREIELREIERLEAAKKLEEERYLYRLKFMASLKIQSIVRMYQCKKRRVIAKGALEILHKAFRKYQDKIQGARLLESLKEKNCRERMEEEERQTRVYDDWLEANRRQMELEDDLVRALMDAERSREMFEKKCMHEEEEYMRRFLGMEKQREQIENAMMNREDERYHEEVKRAEMERSNMEHEEKWMQRHIRSCTHEFESHFDRNSKSLCISNGRYVSLEYLPHAYSSLENIDAMENCFASIADVLPPGARDALRTLNMAQNRITSLVGIVRCDQLTMLNLSFNHLTTTASLKPLSYLRRLRHLDLSGNAFETSLDFSSIVHPTAPMESLDLSQCGLVEHPKIDSKTLTTLVLSKNRITQNIIHSGSSLQSLQNLDLSDNRLTSIRPVPKSALPRLTVLNLRGSIAGAATELIECVSYIPRLQNLNVLPFVMSDIEMKQISHISTLEIFNDDRNFRYKAFDDEITKVQSAIRGALTRKKLEQAILNSRALGFDDDDDEVDFEEINLDSLICEDFFLEEKYVPLPDTTTPREKVPQAWTASKPANPRPVPTELPPVRTHKPPSDFTRQDSVTTPNNNPRNPTLPPMHTPGLILTEPSALFPVEGSPQDSARSFRSQNTILPPLSSGTRSVKENRGFETNHHPIPEIRAHEETKTVAFVPVRHGAAADRQRHMMKSKRTMSMKMPAWMSRKKTQDDLPPI